MTDDQQDLFGLPTMTPTVRRVIRTHEAIQEGPADKPYYLHPVLCQVGMPRKAVEGRVFSRESGTASLLLEAGQLRLGGKWVEQPLPYGPKPRVTLAWTCAEAVRTKSRTVEVGRSMREFLGWLGIQSTGGANGSVTSFKKQIQALAACRMTLGMSRDGRDVTMKRVEPIERFEAWIAADDRPSMWPGVLELSERFYDILKETAVPLDPRAIVALSNSALALDVYAFLAHRLRRVEQPAGVRLSWESMHHQFGQEYSDTKDFKKEFRKALKSVLAVYPDAKVEDAPGGLLMRPSRPPIPETRVRGNRLEGPRDK